MSSESELGSGRQDLVFVKREEEETLELQTGSDHFPAPGPLHHLDPGSSFYSLREV